MGLSQAVVCSGPPRFVVRSVDRMGDRTLVRVLFLRRAFRAGSKGVVAGSNRKLAEVTGPVISLADDVAAARRLSRHLGASLLVSPPGDLEHVRTSPLTRLRYRSLVLGRLEKN
jgi:hypothetical protein